VIDDRAQTPTRRRGRKKGTHSSHHTGTIVSIRSTLLWVSYTRGIGLAAEENRVYEWLRLVEIPEQERGCRDEAKQHGELVRGEKAANCRHFLERLRLF
jgi:hypothetical protein